MNFKWLDLLVNYPLQFFPNEDILAMNDDIGDINDDKVDDDNADDNKEDDKEDDKVDEDLEEDKEDKGEEDKEEEDKEKEDEDKDKEEEEEDKEEDLDLELKTTITDIKKYDPDFFKKFPDVKSAMFREQRYVETVGTLEQAESLAKKANVLDSIDEDLNKKGDPTALLDTLYDNKDTFPKVMNRILPYLQEKDKDLYLEIAAVPIKQLCRAAWREGKGNTTNLGKAAAYIHSYFFNGNLDIESPLKNERVGKAEEKSEAEKKLEEKLKEIETKELVSFSQSVDNSYIDRMTKEIRSSLDKDDRLSDYTKGKLIEDILIDIKEQLDSDKRFVSQRSALWEQAKKAGYTNDFKSRLLSTVLARAKSLIPESRKKIVAKALGRRQASNDSDKDKGNTNTNREKFRSSTRRDSSRREEPKKPLTDMDILRS